MPDPNDFGLLPRLLRSVSQSQNRLPTPQQTGRDFRLAGTLAALEILKDPLSLFDNITATAVEAANVGLRQGYQAGIQTALQRGAEILRELPAYAPLGAEPKFSGGWTRAAEAAGYVDNPEMAGNIMSFLAPTGLPARATTATRPFSVTNAIIDARYGTGLDEVRDLYRYYANNRKKKASEYDLYFNKALEWRDKGILIAYRSAGQTGYGTEGVRDIVFSTMFPEIGENYAKKGEIPGVMGWRIPQSAKIYQFRDDVMTLDEATADALDKGYHVIQRSSNPHELILTRHFFNDFKDVKPEAVRLTGSAPKVPLDQQKPGGQENLGQYVSQKLTKPFIYDVADYLPRQSQGRLQEIARTGPGSGKPFSIIPADIEATISRRGGIYLSTSPGNRIYLQRIAQPDRPDSIILLHDQYYIDTLDNPLTRDFALKTRGKLSQGLSNADIDRVVMHPRVNMYEPALHPMIGKNDPRFSNLREYWENKLFNFQTRGEPVTLADPSQIPYADKMVPLHSVANQIATPNRGVFVLNGSQLEALRQGKPTYSMPISIKDYDAGYWLMAQAAAKTSGPSEQMPVMYIVVPRKSLSPAKSVANGDFADRKNWQKLSPNDISEVYAVRMIARIPKPSVPDNIRNELGPWVDTATSLYGVARITDNIKPPRPAIPTGKAPNPQNPRPAAQPTPRPAPQQQPPTPPPNTRKP